ncbi:transposase [Ectobacillus funiculus]
MNRSARTPSNGGRTSNRSKMEIEVEPVFGQIKHNRCFNRFSLRGLAKNQIDWRLICAAYN